MYSPRSSNSSLSSCPSSCQCRGSLFMNVFASRAYGRRSGLPTHCPPPPSSGSQDVIGWQRDSRIGFFRSAPVTAKSPPWAPWDRYLLRQKLHQPNAILDNIGDCRVISPAPAQFLTSSTTMPPVPPRPSPLAPSHRFGKPPISSSGVDLQRWPCSFQTRC